MDEDVDLDSQSELVGSLSCWMIQNLSPQTTVPDKKLRVLLQDTVLLHDGHLSHWLFTSSRSGYVVKRANKRLEWDGLVAFLVRWARRTRGNRTTQDSWPPAEVIATARRVQEGRFYPVMLTAQDIKSLREKHNAHLLDEIVAIQPFVAKNRFTGCGVFETEFQRKGRKRTAQVALATHELLRWPDHEVKLFDDFGSPSVRSSSNIHRQSGESCAPWRRSDGCAKRVHGIIHRLLATTTKQIVAHVEQKTEETILKVVVQFAFRPGSGQPTLLWLDSVHTVRSTQQSGGGTSGGATNPNNEFYELTRDLGEGSTRSWTTYFPPKIGELTRGIEYSGGGGASRAPESLQAEFLPDRMKESFAAEVEVCGKSRWGKQRQDDASRGPRRENEKPTIEFSAVLRSHEEKTVEFDTPAADQMGGGGKKGDLAGDEESTHIKDDGSSDKTQDRGHFTLPTESWAHRSVGRRGLYFSGTGERGARAGRSVSEQWPRKRSTGTSMRLDCSRERSDLRSAAENRLPWASSGPAGGMGHGGSCFGDYCHYESLCSPNRGSDSGGDYPGDGKGTVCPVTNRGEAQGTASSKLVSYRSILKSRAEEMALNSWRLPPSVQCNMEKICGKEESHRFPTLCASEGTGGMHLKKKGQVCLASLIAERMRTLVAGLSDQGSGEYFRLGSSDRATASVPEAAQRAVDELIYEEFLSRLHPTTANRPVAVCDTCALVYGYMDAYRRQAKQVKAASANITRVARIVMSRREQRGRAQLQPTTPERHGSALLLRRYSDLNLGAPPRASAVATTRGARPTTSDGLTHVGSTAEGISTTSTPIRRPCRDVSAEQERARLRGPAGRKVKADPSTPRAEPASVV